jgi:hypothetical protein
MRAERFGTFWHPFAYDAEAMSKRSAWILCLGVYACGTPPEPASVPTPTTVSEPVAEPTPVGEPPASSPVEPEASTACPSPEHSEHCLWMATNPPNPKRATHVAKKLVADGYEAVADGDRIIVHADDERLKKLFGGEIEHVQQAASSSDRMRCVAAIPEGRKLDARYRGEVGEVLLDDPACEL